MLVCEKCGGKGVQVLAWVNANTNHYESEGPMTGEPESNWCIDCEEHIYLIEEEIYLKNKEDE